MTAETLKPFLATSSAPNASRGQKSLVVSMTNNAGSDTDDNDYHTDTANGRQSPVLAARRNALLFSFCAIVSICVLALIGAQIWNTLRTTRLQHEVQQMDGQLKGLMRLMGLDNGINLEELYEVYREAEQKHPIQQVSDEEISDDDGEYEEYETNDRDIAKFLQDFENEDYSEEDDVLASGDYDGDDDDIYDNDDADAEVDGSPMYMDKEETSIKRQTRSLTDDLHFGTIVEVKDKDDIMQHLIPYQELSPNDQNDFHSERPKSRRSRVIASLLNERVDAKKIPSKKERFAKTQRLKKEAATHIKLTRNGGRTRPIGLMRKNLSTKSARRSHPIAVHYVGHTDHYNTNYHQNYAGNGRLQHHGGVYADWKPANWSSSLMADRFFSMTHGVVTVQEPGLYHVYAQIYYYDAADESSFWVDHNERHLLQCATTVISARTEPKASTCYTAGLVYLNSGDRIRVHDVLRHYALLRSERSFFGLVRLSGGGGGGGGSIVRSGEDSV